MKVSKHILLSATVLIFFLLNTFAASAQTPLHVYDAGEKTYHAKKFKKRKKKKMFVMTEWGVYQIKRSPKRHKKIYTPPAGVFINDMSPSKLPNGDDRMLLVLSNNTVSVLDPFSGNTVRTFNGPSTNSGEFTRKIVGDDMWAQTNIGLIYLSVDSGLHWNIDTAGLHGFMYTIAVDTSGNCYASTGNGLFRQNVGAPSWTMISGISGTISFTWIDSKNYLWASDNYGTLQRSNNGGNVFVNDTVGLHGKTRVMTDDSLGYYFAITQTGFPNNGNRIYRKTSIGAAWTRIDMPIMAMNNDPNNDAIYTDITSDDTSVVVTTIFGTFISDDEGTTWQYVTAGMEPEENYSFLETSNNHYLVSTNMGVFDNDFMNDTIWHHRLPNNTFTKTARLFRDNSGNIYTQSNPIALYSNVLDVKKSTDNGLTWTSDTSGISAVNQFTFWVDENGTQHIASLGNSLHGVYIWKKTSSGSYVIDTTGFQSPTYDYPTTFGTNGNGTVYLGTLFGAKNVWRYNNNAWVLDNLGIDSVPVYDFEVDHSGKMIAGTWGFGLWHQTGGPGSAWVPMNYPSGVNGGSSAFFEAVDTAGNIFTCFSSPDATGNYLGSGVFETADNGVTWNNLGVDTLTFRQFVAVNDTVFGVSYYNGIWKFTASGLIGIDVPTVESMSSFVTPNPSNNQIVIENLNAEKFESTSLRIFDGTGKLVQIVPVYHQGESINIESLPQGIYYIWCYANHHQQALRFVKQ